MEFTGSFGCEGSTPQTISDAAMNSTVADIGSSERHIRITLRMFREVTSDAVRKKRKSLSETAFGVPGPELTIDLPTPYGS